MALSPLPQNDIIEKRNKIIELQFKQEELKKEELSLIEELQKECKHKSFLEFRLGFVKKLFCRQNNRRICFSCCFEEEEKNDDKFYVLSDKTPFCTNDFDKFVKYREWLPLKYILVPFYDIDYS